MCSLQIKEEGESNIEIVGKGVGQLRGSCAQCNSRRKTEHKNVEKITARA